MKTDFENQPFFQVWSLPLGSPHCLYFTLFHFGLRNGPFQRQNVTQIDSIGLDWTYDNPSPHFVHSTLIFFITEYIVQSHFVSVLKTLSHNQTPVLWTVALYSKCQVTTILRIFGTSSLRRTMTFSFTSWQHFSTKTYQHRFFEEL